MATRSMTDPEFDVQDLYDTICRSVDAAQTGGFDGREHPEHMPVVRAVFSAMYPFSQPDAVIAAIRRTNQRIT